MINTRAIKSRMTKLDISSKELAEVCALDNAYLNLLVNGYMSLTLDIADRLQYALEIDADIRERIWLFNPKKFDFDFNEFIGMTKMEAVFYCDKKSRKGYIL